MRNEGLDILMKAVIRYIKKYNGIEKEEKNAPLFL
jgi:hypothetical protein